MSMRCSCTSCPVHAAVVCECGRELTRAGYAVHRRSCRVEAARSALWVEAVQAGLDPYAALATWRRAGRPTPGGTT